MDVMQLRRNLIMQIVHKKGLPDEYQQVRYIASDGYAFIDTGVYGNNDTSVKLDFRLDEIKDSMFFGDRVGPSDSAYCFLVRGGTWFATSFDGSGNQDLLKNKSAAIANTDRHVIYQNKKDAYFDDEVRTRGENTMFTTSKTLLIFRSHHMPDYVLGIKLRVYSCIIDNDGTVVRNFIPCYRKSDNEPGMYDMITGIFFMNAGNGSFSIPSDNVDGDLLNFDDRSYKVLGANGSRSSDEYDTNKMYWIILPTCKLYYSYTYQTFTFVDGVLSYPGYGNNTYGALFPIEVEPGTTYYVSGDFVNFDIYINYADSSGTVLANGTNITATKSFTAPANASFGLLVFKIHDKDENSCSNVKVTTTPIT